MKHLIILIILLAVYNETLGQSPNTFFADNNPKLTDTESVWLNKNFPVVGFDYKGKYVTFREMTPGSSGLGKVYELFRKNRLKDIGTDTLLYMLYVLDKAERKESGYDAVLLFTSQRHSIKWRRIKFKKYRERLVNGLKNNYVQLPWDAGVDTNSQLNKTNAEFFNILYVERMEYLAENDLYMGGCTNPIDFTGKRVAIFDTHSYNQVRRVSIREYVNHVKSYVDQWGQPHADYLRCLSAEQKEKTGYDILIEYQCKKCVPVERMLKEL